MPLWSRKQPTPPAFRSQRLEETRGQPGAAAAASPTHGAVHTHPTGPRAVPLLCERTLHERRGVSVLARDRPREPFGAAVTQHHHRAACRLEEPRDDMSLFPSWKMPRRRRVRVFARGNGQACPGCREDSPEDRSTSTGNSARHCRLSQPCSLSLFRRWELQEWQQLPIHAWPCCSG